MCKARDDGQNRLARRVPEHGSRIAEARKAACEQFRNTCRDVVRCTATKELESTARATRKMVNEKVANTIKNLNTKITVLIM